MNKLVVGIPLIFLCATALAGCDLGGGGKTVDADLISIAGAAIDPAESQAAAVEAIANYANVNYWSDDRKVGIDDSGIYKNGLAEYATVGHSYYYTSMTAYSNLMLSLSGTYESSMKTFGAYEINDYYKTTEVAWAGEPISTALADYYSLFIAKTQSDKDGHILEDDNLVALSRFAKKTEIDGVWGRYLNGVFSHYYSYGSTTSYVKADDGTIIGSNFTGSVARIDNPLYSGSGAQYIEENIINQNVCYFVKNATYGYVLQSVKHYVESFVGSDFESNLLSSPLAIESQEEEVKFTYGEKTVGTVPVYDGSFSNLANPVLTLFTPSDSGATYQSYDILADITLPYKMTNPSFVGHAYRTELALSSLTYYSFSTDKDVQTATQIYDKWGFNDIDSSSVGSGNISSAGVTGNNLFKLISGTYDILVLTKENGDLSSISITFLKAA